MTARLIDRPIRPMFKEGYKNEIQIINTVLSVDNDCSPEMAAMLGSSLAITISEVPFDGPIAGVNVGRVHGDFVINPTLEQQKESDLELTVAGTKTAINMVESSAQELSEEEMLEALLFGHATIKELCYFQEEVRQAIGKEKADFQPEVLPEDLEEDIYARYHQKMVEAIQIFDKLEREEGVQAVKDEMIAFYEEQFAEDEDLESKTRQVAAAADKLEYEEVRRLITEEKAVSYTHLTLPTKRIV